MLWVRAATAYLWCAKGICGVRLGLWHLLIVNANGHNQYILNCIRPQALHQHANEAKPQRPHSATSRSPSLGEELDAAALLHERLQVLQQRAAVVCIASKGALDEEGASSSQEGTHNGHVQVDASCNVWQRQVIAAQNKKGESEHFR